MKSFFSFLKKSTQGDQGEKGAKEKTVSFPFDSSSNTAQSNSQGQDTSGNVLESIISQTQLDKEKKFILGPKPPPLPSSSFRPLSAERNLRYASMFFQLVVYISLLSLAFFSLQLAKHIPYLEEIFNYKTPVAKLASLHETLKTQQSEVNYKRYSIVKINLDRFIYLTDQYISASSGLDSLTGLTDVSEEKVSLTTSKDQLQEDITSTLRVIQENLSHPLTPENTPNPYIGTLDPTDKHPLTLEEADRKWLEDYETALKTYLDDRRALLQSPSDDAETDASSDDQSERKLAIINNIPILVQRRNFLAKALNDLDFENISKKDIRQLLDTFHSVSKNNLSVITKIKSNRINWTQNLKYIEEITRGLDSYFGKNDKDFTKIYYNNYSFNAVTNQITITGEIRTDVATIFDEVIELIETFNKSPYFEVTNDIRRFSKTRKDQKYLSSISLTLSLTEPEESLTAREPL